MTSLSFYYDIASPHAYLTALRLEVLSQRTGVVLSWRPISGDLLAHLTGAAALSVETWSPARAALGRLDLQRLATHTGTRLCSPLPSPSPATIETLRRLLVACPADRRPALSLDLMRALWTDGADVSSPDGLQAYLDPQGLDLSLAHTPHTASLLRKITEEAIEKGVFAAPALVSGDRLWWGTVDRLPLLEAALQPTTPHLTGIERGDAAGAAPVSRIRFFHDLASPFSYLAATQLERLAAERGVTVVWTPILLGALFRDIGTPDVPLFAMAEARRAYLYRDLQDWAGWWGVPFRFPRVFPIRTVLPLRICLLEPAATLPLYRALWAEDQDIGDPAVVRRVLEHAGWDGEALLAATQQPAVKARLQENTALARERGVCGVPTVEVGEVLLWGQDRLPLLAGVLDGRYEIT